MVTNIFCCWTRAEAKHSPVKAIMDLVGVSCYRSGAADCLRHQVREEPTVLQMIFKGKALLFCYGLHCGNQRTELSIQTNSLLKQCAVIGEIWWCCDKEDTLTLRLTL